MRSGHERKIFSGCGKSAPCPVQSSLIFFTCNAHEKRSDKTTKYVPHDVDKRNTRSYGNILRRRRNEQQLGTVSVSFNLGEGSLRS